MKISYTCTAQVPSRTAYSVHVMKMCSAFAATGHEVTLLASKPRLRNATNELDVFSFYGAARRFRISRLPMPSIRGKFIIFGLFCHFANMCIRPNLVYSRSLFAAFFSAMFGIQTVFEAHGLMEGALSKLCLRILASAKRAHILVVISEAMRRIYSTQYHINLDRLLVAHDAADEQPDFRPLQDWPGRAGILQIGYAGHLYAGRGIEVILELGRRIPDVDIHCVGGTEQDIAFWKTHAPPGNVFFHGYIEPSQVYRFRNSCDILIAPYQRRVMISGGSADTAAFMSPLKIFEYMSAKKPIICSDLPVLREILNQNNAVLVGPSDISAWVRAVLALRDVNLRMQIAERAYGDFIANHTWSKRVERILDAVFTPGGHRVARL